ncbi:YcxB family protein [Flavobacterium reichenbachii]|uniref:YcxB-like C-terminal domain-containing protein n=1 Tax=Flavobacterium reichenbachii TaxID=362418 RepID=A0A085ZG31_9FLAO|nr:YcxB family protein [Flavobacterium reichenbachii]KFF03395.1 hypothetical protein IW19_21135 [Flavobacterium reichenbachii]OXB16758.1 hypothetical protein B0A68_06420 [Flavobacterium reichenbachii]
MHKTELINVLDSNADIMNTAAFSLEFKLNISEIRKLNKMYFKHLYKEKVTIFSSLLLFGLILFDYFRVDHKTDLIQWMIRSLILIIVFLFIQYSIVDAICKLIFKLAKKLLRFDSFISKYKFNFTNSSIYVHSPLGEFAHQWTEIEKAILTKDFFFLYVKKRNGYIITISNKCSDKRNIEQLITFVESNVTHVTKV